jgi:hypothetical protein
MKQEENPGDESGFFESRESGVTSCLEYYCEFKYKGPGNAFSERQPCFPCCRHVVASTLFEVFRRTPRTQEKNRSVNG